MKMLSLHTDGRYIKDEYGRILNFTGTTEAQTSWRYDTHEYWDPLSDPIPMAERMAELGVTWVRICINHEFWIDLSIEASYKDLIDRYVQEFTARNVYCTVGLMSHDLKDDQAGWLSFLTELANRYKDNPGMCGIFIFNEPPMGTATWRQWAVLGAEAVHNANPNLLIVVEVGLPNRQGIDPYWLSNPISVPNVVYAYHDYFWQYHYYGPVDFTLSYEAGNYALAKQQMEAYFYDRFWKYAVEHNMCIMNEEFGFGIGQEPGEMGWNPGFPQCMHDYLELHNKYRIPWCYYAWHMGGYELTADGYNLNVVGQIWLKYLTPTLPIDLPTIGGIALAITDALLVGYYIYTKVAGKVTREGAK